MNKPQDSRSRIVSVVVALVLLSALFACNPFGRSVGYRTSRLSSSETTKREIARESRNVLTSGGEHRFDLSPRDGCVAHLGYGVSDPGPDEFFGVELLDEQGATLRFEQIRAAARSEVQVADENEVDAKQEDEKGHTGWDDFELPIDSSAKTLVLHSAPQSGVWALPIINCATSEVSDPLNVILISLDTLRADRLGIYGNTDGLTPTLDNFGRRNMFFKNAFTTFPNTLGSHASLFTSYHPKQHGLMTASGKRIPVGANTLARHFAEHGYATAAFTENAFVSSHIGFDEGFDRYHNGPDGSGDLRFPGVAELTFQRGVDWLEQRPRGPFFLFLHTYEVHTPYTPEPEALQVRLDAAGIEYEGKFKVAFGGLGEIAFNRRTRTFDDAEIAQIVRLYDAEVTILDAAVEGLFDKLDRLGLMGNTLIAIFADHGDAFNEHGYLAHGESVYTQVMHVPLMIRAPGALGGPRRIDETASLIDVGPTVAALAGIAPFAPESPGRDLAAWVRGESEPTDEPVFGSLNESDTSCAEFAKGKFKPCPFDALAVRDGMYSYIRSGVFGWEQLYDMRTDPAELTDISGDSPELLAKYRKIADDHDAYTAETALPTARAELDNVTSEKLKALGYIE